jgi:hypothetical protein
MEGWSSKVTDFRSAACASSSDEDRDAAVAEDAVGRGFLVGEGGWTPFLWAACEGRVRVALTALALCVCRATL